MLVLFRLQGWKCWHNPVHRLPRTSYPPNIIHSLDCCEVVCGSWIFQILSDWIWFNQVMLICWKSLFYP